MTRIILTIVWLCLCHISSMANTPIFGTPEVDAEAMYDYVVRRNPDFNREIADAFYEVGLRYGIRGDIALCQAIIETGWFRFNNGTAVPPHAHNYCGLGVTRRGDTGCRFASVEEGVTAMLQHLYAYAGAAPLPDGEKVIDPRFNYVARGCAPSWERLSGRWAMNPGYGNNILRIFADLKRRSASGTPVTTIELIEVYVPDDIFDDIEDDFGNYDSPHDVNQGEIAPDCSEDDEDDATSQSEPENSIFE